jgi:hypothetical protein
VPVMPAIRILIDWCLGHFNCLQIFSLLGSLRTTHHSSDVRLY